jgi:hypothetical protein
LEDISEFVFFAFGGVIPLPLCAGPKNCPYFGVVESSVFMYYHKPFYVYYFQEHTVQRGAAFFYTTVIGLVRFITVIQVDAFSNGKSSSRCLLYDLTLSETGFLIFLFAQTVDFYKHLASIFIFLAEACARGLLREESSMVST